MHKNERNTRTLQTWHIETVDWREKTAKNWKYITDRTLASEYIMPEEVKTFFWRKKNWLLGIVMILSGPLTVRGYSITQVKLQPHNTQLWGFITGQFYVETILTDFATRMNGQQMTNWGKTLQLTRWNWTPFHLFISFLISFPLKREIQSIYGVICDSVKKVINGIQCKQLEYDLPPLHLQGLCLPTWKSHT